MTALERIRVHLAPPPCDRSFSLGFRENGDLRWVEIDGVFYAAVRRKRTTLFHGGDRAVELVKVIAEPED